jgi:hypothetical protein
VANVGDKVESLYGTLLAAPYISGCTNCALNGNASRPFKNECMLQPNGMARNDEFECENIIWLRDTPENRVKVATEKLRG